MPGKSTQFRTNNMETLKAIIEGYLGATAIAAGASQENEPSSNRMTDIADSW